ncbi:MAG: hypothetical protein K2X77_15270 [Candidatus Obscuribacterales bacterium]|nr:hypothetical protein [Candidatus Obscuribacterales bacterium]
MGDSIYGVTPFSNLLNVMHKNWLSKLLLGTLVYMSSTSALCLADVSSISKDDGDHTFEAVSLFNKGRLNDAMVLAQKAVEQSPQEWKAHAILGFLSWKQGDVVLALQEAEKASQLDPGNPKLLENLAEMNEILGDFAAAAAVYKQMLSNSESSVAGLGLARCNAKMPDKRMEALGTLAEMASAHGKDSDWYAQIADTYLQLGEAYLASQTAVKADKCANTLEKKRRSRSLRLLALLKANQTKDAADLVDLVFYKCESKSPELYVLAAQKLLDQHDIVKARRILHSATESLTSREDSDCFFRMGRVFHEIASSCSQSPRKYEAWIDLSADAYAHASKLEPEQGRYHLALAGTMPQQGDLAPFLDELAKAKNFDQFDSLAPFLLSRFSSQSDSKSEAPRHMKLTKATFKLKGVNCSCHLSKVERTLAAQKSVAFACIRRPEYNGSPFNSESENKAQEYEGTLFVEAASADLAEIFAKCSKEFFSQPGLKSSFEFEVVGSVPLNEISEAVRIAHNAKYPDPGKFIDQIRVIEPTLPIDDVKQASKNSPALF